MWTSGEPQTARQISRIPVGGSYQPGQVFFEINFIKGLLFLWKKAVIHKLNPKHFTLLQSIESRKEKENKTKQKAREMAQWMRLLAEQA